MTTELISFDGTERCPTTLHSPTETEELPRLFNDGPVAVRGSGLSYPLASAVEDGTTISTGGFANLLGFDSKSSTISVQTGMTVGKLLQIAVRTGHYFPVLPGHPQITVGGCVAFNTHGKTQHDTGNMHRHVVGLTLYHPDHGIIRCSPTQDADLFDLTVGGMGLTGLIIDVQLKLEPLPGLTVQRRAIPVDNFCDAVAEMEARDTPGTRLYSWNDANRRGRGFGRGVVFAESFVDAGAETEPHYRSLQSDHRARFAPIPLWNRATTSAVNTVWYHLTRRTAATSLPVLDAAFPMNRREMYFHLFGRRGFRETQVVIPRCAWVETTARIRRAIEHTGSCITLSSLKLFSGPTRLLWFQGPGVCLTLDGPANDSTRLLFDELDKMAIDLGAPVNLAKDSRLDATAALRIFPEYELFRDRLQQFDPLRRFDSNLRRRIGV